MYHVWHSFRLGDLDMLRELFQKADKLYDVGHGFATNDLERWRASESGLAIAYIE